MNKKFKLFESGDTIILPNKEKLSWKDKDAIPFAFNYVVRDVDGYNTSIEDFWIGTNSTVHNFSGVGRTSTGRVWIESKIISFWQTPKQEIFLECVKKVEEKLDLKILNNDWKIEIKTRNRNKVYHKGMFMFSLIPIEEYSESEPDTKGYIDHLDKKKNKHVQGNFGSKRLKPLALRQKMYTESLNETLNTDTIEKLLNIKSNFSLCSRCGSQLHHTLKICKNCGKKNTNNGSTIKQMLYNGKHRQITKKPLFVTPLIIYNTYKGQLSGVSKEEFLDYVDNRTTGTPAISGGSVKYAKRKPLAYRQKMYQENFVTKFENFTQKVSGNVYKYGIKIGKIYWFEYHCLESSCDAKLWYRSHQEVEVIAEVETEPGEPKVYTVKFIDGFVGDVFDDELLISSDGFYRSEPPKILQKIS